LMIESLEGRALMSAGGSFVDEAVVDARASGFSLNFAEIEFEFTPPIGTDKGSFAGSFAGDGLGSAHGSVVDGTSNTVMFRSGARRELAAAAFNAPHTYPEAWATFPSSFSGDAYVNEMGVIGPRREANGIIAVLIGLLQSPQSAGGEVSSLTVGTQSTKGSVALPYVEQENVYEAAGQNGLLVDVILAPSYMEEDGIWYLT
jgi:hypothetical protein